MSKRKHGAAAGPSSDSSGGLRAGIKRSLSHMFGKDSEASDNQHSRPKKRSKKRAKLNLLSGGRKHNAALEESDPLPPSPKDDDFISFLHDVSEPEDDNNDAKSIRSVFMEYEQAVADQVQAPDRWGARDVDSDEEDNRGSRGQNGQGKGPSGFVGAASLSQTKTTTSSSSAYPWIQADHDHSREQEMADWLTLEIRDFVSYMAPSHAEVEARGRSVNRIRAIVRELWPDADIHVFGSFATELYLPGSDIDMVVISESGRYTSPAYLHTLSARLRSRGVARNIEVLAHTRVPIIKYVDAQSDVHIDVSFERLNGLEAVKTIKAWLAQFPELRYFVLVIKQFLARRRLNEVHSGGIGGFSVVCMVVSFLSNHPRIASRDITVEANLGVLLIEFFELYGINFNYETTALRMDGDMRYLRKAENPHLVGRGLFGLSIQDPNDSSNNLSAGSYNIRTVKRAFGGAFELLTRRCYELDAMPLDRRAGESILGDVIKFRGEQRQFRDWTNVGQISQSWDEEEQAYEQSDEDGQELGQSNSVSATTVSTMVSNTVSSTNAISSTNSAAHAKVYVISSDDEPEPVPEVKGQTQEEPSRTAVSLAKIQEYWLNKGKPVPTPGAKQVQ